MPSVTADKRSSGRSVQASWGFIGASASAFTPDPRGNSRSPKFTRRHHAAGALVLTAAAAQDGDCPPSAAHPIIMPSAAFSVPRSALTEQDPRVPTLWGPGRAWKSGAGAVAQTMRKKPFHLQRPGRTGPHGTPDLSAMPLGSKVGVRGAGVGVLQKDVSGPKR